MSDLEDDGFNEDTFKGLEEQASITPPTGDDDGATPPADPPKEEPKKNEEPPKKEDDNVPPATEPPAPEDKKEEEGATPPKAPETPPKAAENPETPEEPKPLTRDDLASVINDVRTTERASVRELENTTNDVLESYYPDGLSNTLIDEASGKELRSPQDVVDVTDGKMSIEQAAQWLLNEQTKLDRSVNEIKDQARKVAETTLSFKHDGEAVLQRYDPLFKALKDKYPQLQDKVFQALMKQTKVDKEKGVILSAPDVMDHYDTFLAPYKEIYEEQTQQPATNPAPPPPAPPKPTADDRMDEFGDGGQAPVNDPNDFAQQVTKELAKGI